MALKLHGDKATALKLHVYPTTTYLLLTNEPLIGKPRWEPEPQPVPATHKPKRKACTYKDSDSDIDYEAEANADAIVAPRKADKGKAKAVDPPGDLSGSPILRVCSNFLTL